MNKELLLRMADYIETIPQEMFDMEVYRHGSEKSIHCDSIGCALGHCIHLFPEEEIEYNPDGSIYFFRTGMYLDLTSNEWDWCFSTYWLEIDNTPKGAAKRIRMLANGEVPTGWLIEWHDWTNIKY